MSCLVMYVHFSNTSVLLYGFVTGESAVRNIINQGHRAAAAASDPEKSRIEKVCNELDRLLDDLAALRKQGKVIVPSFYQSLYFCSSLHNLPCLLYLLAFSVLFTFLPSLPCLLIFYNKF